MFNKSLINIDKPGYQFFFLLALMGASFIIVSLVGSLIGSIFFGTEIFNTKDLNLFLNDPQKLGMIKYLQIISQLGFFIIPPLIFARFVSTGSVPYFGLRTKTYFVSLIAIALTILLSTPVINFLMELNMKLSFPPSLQGIGDWVEQTENSANDITKAFFTDTSPVSFIINILMIAIIPAIGEELLFRGCFQQILQKWTGKKHLAVFLAAFIFSAFHFQFLSFLPRLMLGMFLGYVFLWTGNLWSSILAHFVNNISAVVIAYLYYNGKTDIPMDEFGSVHNIFLLIINVLILISLISFIYFKEKSKPVQVEIHDEVDG